MKAIGVSGKIAAGKSTVAAAISEAIDGAALVSFGDFVRAEAARRGDDVESRVVLQDLGNELITSLGAVEFTRRVATTAGSSPSVIVFDGVRHKDIAAAIRDHFETFMVYVVAEEADRSHRWALRDEGLNVETLGIASAHVVENEIPELMLKADLLVEGNEAGLATAIEACRAFMNRG